MVPNQEQLVATFGRSTHATDSTTIGLTCLKRLSFSVGNRIGVAGFKVPKLRLKDSSAWGIRRRVAPWCSSHP